MHNTAYKVAVGIPGGIVRNRATFAKEKPLQIDSF